MKQILAIFLFVIFSSICVAQNNYKITLGIGAEVGAKLYPIKYYNALATLQPSLILRIQKEQSNALGLWLNLGMLIDPSYYNLASESTAASKSYIGMVHHNISFSGLILFPTKKEELKILVGIGMDYNLEIVPAHRTKGNASYSWNNVGKDLDSIQYVIDENRRRFLPSVSVGLQYEVPKIQRLKLYCIFRQNLLNSFEVDIPVYSIATGKTDQNPTNYKPSYLKLGMSYDFW